MQEQLQTLTLEEAFAHELAKDVKLKGGGTAIDSNGEDVGVLSSP